MPSLEVVAQKQQKHSELLAQSGGRHGIGPPRYRTLAIWLDAAPDVIEDRIQKRTESMFQDGIFDENVQLYEQLKLAYGNDLDKVYGTGIGQAIGFREFRHCFEASGELLAGALRQSVVDLNRNTFRFAKRQQRNIASWFGGRDNLPVFRIDTSGTVGSHRVVDCAFIGRVCTRCHFMEQRCSSTCSGHLQV